MEVYPHQDLTERIIGAAIEVHKALGPGLPESAYEQCLCHELELRGLSFLQQAPLTVRCGQCSVECGYRADLIVKSAVLLELQAVERLSPIHKAQLITCLKRTGLKAGLLFNFNEVRLRDGLLRRVLWPLALLCALCDGRSDVCNDR